MARSSCAFLSSLVLLSCAARADAAVTPSHAPCEWDNSSAIVQISLDEALQCYAAVPFNATVARRTLTSVRAAVENYSFRDTMRYTGPPWDVKVDIGGMLTAMMNASFDSDYDFHEAVAAIFRSVNDAHTVYTKPVCYLAEALQPVSIIARVVEGYTRLTLGRLYINGVDITAAWAPPSLTSVDDLINATIIAIDGVRAWVALDMHTQRLFDGSDDAARFTALITRFRFVWRRILLMPLPVASSMTWVLSLVNGSQVSVSIPWRIFAPAGMTAAAFAATCTPPVLNATTCAASGGDTGNDAWSRRLGLPLEEEEETGHGVRMDALARAEAAISRLGLTDARGVVHPHAVARALRSPPQAMPAQDTNDDSIAFSLLHELASDADSIMRAACESDSAGCVEADNDAAFAAALARHHARMSLTAAPAIQPLLDNDGPSLVRMYVSDMLQSARGDTHAAVHRQLRAAREATAYTSACQRTRGACADFHGYDDVPIPLAARGLGVIPSTPVRDASSTLTQVRGSVLPAGARNVTYGSQVVNQTLIVDRASDYGVVVVSDPLLNMLRVRISTFNPAGLTACSTGDPCTDTGSFRVVLCQYYFYQAYLAFMFNATQDPLVRGAARYIVFDLTSNGGGNVFLGQCLLTTLFQELHVIGTNSTPRYTVRTTDLYASTLALMRRRPFLNDVSSPGLTSFFLYHGPGNYSAVSRGDPTWYSPGQQVYRGDGLFNYSQSFFAYDPRQVYLRHSDPIPIALNSSNVIAITDGLCGSMCGQFLKTISARDLARVLHVGGLQGVTGAPTSFTGGFVTTIGSLANGLSTLRAAGWVPPPGVDTIDVLPTTATFSINYGAMLSWTERNRFTQFDAETADLLAYVWGTTDQPAIEAAVRSSLVLLASMPLRGTDGIIYPIVTPSPIPLVCADLSSTWYALFVLAVACGAAAICIALICAGGYCHWFCGCRAAQSIERLLAPKDGDDISTPMRAPSKAALVSRNGSMRSGHTGGGVSARAPPAGAAASQRAMTSRPHGSGTGVQLQRALSAVAPPHAGPSSGDEVVDPHLHAVLASARAMAGMTVRAVMNDTPPPTLHPFLHSSGSVPPASARTYDGTLDGIAMTIASRGPQLLPNGFNPSAASAASIASMNGGSIGRAMLPPHMSAHAPTAVRPAAMPWDPRMLAPVFARAPSNGIAAVEAQTGSGSSAGTPGFLPGDVITPPRQNGGVATTMRRAVNILPLPLVPQGVQPDAPGRPLGSDVSPMAPSPLDDSSDAGSADIYESPFNVSGHASVVDVHVDAPTRGSRNASATSDEPESRAHQSVVRVMSLRDVNDAGDLTDAAGLNEHLVQAAFNDAT